MTTLSTHTVGRAAAAPPIAARPPLLIGYDGSAAARRAIREAAMLMGTGPAVVVNTWCEAPMGGILPLGPTRFSAASARALGAASLRVAQEGAALASELGLDAEARSVSSALSPGPALGVLAEEHDALTVVAGNSGASGVSALGGTAAALTRTCSRPVLVPSAPGRSRVVGERGAPIVVAYDGTRRAVSAIQHAARLFPGRSALITTLWSGDATPAGTSARHERAISRRRSSLRAAARATAAEGAELARAAGLDAYGIDRLRNESEAATLTDLASSAHAAVLVVPGPSNLSGLAHRSLASSLTGSAHLPVVIVSARAKAPAPVPAHRNRGVPAAWLNRDV